MCRRQHLWAATRAVILVCRLDKNCYRL
jgi:hypothetical protein